MNLSKILLGLDTLQTEKRFAVLDHAFQQGCQTFDTAHVYGRSEALLGKWLTANGVRNDCVIMTKGCGYNALAGRAIISEQRISHELNKSLDRLRTDYIDIYCLHSDDLSKNPEAIIEMLAPHVVAGTIRHLGVSNWTHQRIARANNYARVKDLPLIEFSSPQYSLMVWNRPLFPCSVSISGPCGLESRNWYAEQRIPVLSWSPLARGFCALNYKKTTFFDFLTRKGKKRALQYYGNANNNEKLKRAHWLSQKKGISIFQVLLAYLLNQHFVVHPIVSCGTVDHFDCNYKSLVITLAPDELRYLDLLC